MVLLSKSNMNSKEKVLCEIQFPLVMWKRSVVQVIGGCSKATVTLVLLVTVFSSLWSRSSGADLVIEIPGSGGGVEDVGQYRLDYYPPQGAPTPNFTVPVKASTIKFHGLPGTKYHFMLYYSNTTFADLLTWNQTIITAPDPPTNLSVTQVRNKQATIAWSPPAFGDYTGFRFKVIPLTERTEGGARNITVEASGGADDAHTNVLRDLSPGATYQLHAFTLLQDKESAAYASRNFTTKPNTPGKFIVWFRNETTLLVLWQPPYPPGAYTHYKVSIVPPDARDSELYVEKEGEPPGPAQAAFKGLVPGRAYNISVQTVSEPEISAPTTAQYRTVPLRPRNLTIDPAFVTETSFKVTWLPPQEESEFEKYQVAVVGGGGGRRLPGVVRARDEPPAAAFSGLEPGARYSLTVKTMSGKVTSWPATTDFTLKPLPVRDLQWRYTEGDESGGVMVWWTPAEGSTQNEYKLSYHEAGPTRDDSNTLVTPNTNVTLESLLPGRNYTITVFAVSHGLESNESVFSVATVPLSPVLRCSPGAEGELNLEWHTDVTSRQDTYELRYRRTHPDQHQEQYQTIETRETETVLRDLFPGAVYEIQVAAVSHGLRSERHTVLKPVRPLPATWMGIERATSNAVVVRWRGPGAGSAVGEYVLRYRTHSDPAWTRLAPLAPNYTEADIVDMTHGERYTIQLDTGSEAAAGETVESGQPLSADHTVRPNPVSNVAQLVDTRNMTLEWPRPKGRVEWYSLVWRPEGGEGGEGGAGGRGGERNLTAEPDARTVRALLDALEPGAGYTVTIAAHSYNLTSELFTMDTRTRPLIQSEMTIVNKSDGEENDTLPTIRVLYTPTPQSASRFDSYRFRLEGEGERAREETRVAAGAGQQVTFRDLVPGRLYNVTMWTVSRNVTSHPVQRPVRLYPRAITHLNATQVTSREVTLQWDRPEGDYTDFQIQYLVADNRLASLYTDQLSITVAELEPYTLYTFTVEVRSGTNTTILASSRSFSVPVRTREAPPGAPVAFQPLDARPAELTLRWDLPPELRHGQLKRFVIEYRPHASSDPYSMVEFSPNATTGTVSGLSPGGTYEFRVWAESGAGRGAAATLTQHMAIAAPPRPPPHALVAEVRRSTTTIAVRFRSDYFSQANGNVTAYTLVVAEEPRNESSARLPSWRDVHRLPLWPPYQVTEPYYPFQSSPVEEFTIGSERCEGGGRAYCNGPLKPGVKYYAKLRAFTAPDKFTDTAYTVLYTEVDNTAWIIGACVALAACVCAGGALVALRRRRAARAAPALSVPAPRTSRPVRLADFIDHYRLMSADSDFRFSEEFEELKHVGREQPCTAADLPVNRPKNRFTNILPYDHSRFKLQPVDDEEGSDYINANYVPGHNSPREFIVTQGPLHCTRDDFWRMCWESGSRAIVMLTRCVEKGREKCDRYWPYDTRPVYYGDIAVTALNESRYPDWTVTELLVCRGSDQRVVTHFHFTTWPDFGVPDPPTTLARFVRAFRERCPPDLRPVVVHCSAGVGRSGTFITLDRALQQVSGHAEYIDIFGMVHAMRRERVWMVQTEQQYICIHQCLVAVLEGHDLAVPQPNHNHHLNQAFEDDEGIAESGM